MKQEQLQIHRLLIRTKKTQDMMAQYPKNIPRDGNKEEKKRSKRFNSTKKGGGGVKLDITYCLFHI